MCVSTVHSNETACVLNTWCHGSSDPLQANAHLLSCSSSHTNITSLLFLMSLHMTPNNEKRGKHFVLCK